MNIFFGLVIGGVAAAVFYFRGQQEEKLKLAYESMKPGQKTCPINPLWVVVVVTFVFVLLLITAGTGTLRNRAAGVGAHVAVILLQISVYYVLLLSLLPLLRRVISARACAVLWLTPTVLYLFLLYGSYFLTMRPRLVITLPGQFLPLFLNIWVCGVALVLLWQIVSHLLLRRSLLMTATACEDASALLLWRNELTRHGVKRTIPILISNDVATPLTIGCFERTMRLILPQRDYTQGELALIFRHEQRHILRCDAQAKLLLGFSAALGWFNPLAWVARRKVAEDLELSCDEAILSGADENTRREYAELLLKSAGTGRGYTTCLSAAAGTLRYRLRHAVKPGKRLSGSLAVGAAMFALLATFGAVALAGNPAFAQELIFHQAPQGLVMDRVSVDNWSDGVNGYRRVYGYDEKALTEYIASLTARQVYAGHYYEEATSLPQLYVDYAEMKDGEIASFTRFELRDGLMFVNIPYDDSGAITYILEEEIDWEYISSLLDFAAPNPDPAPQPPELLVRLGNGSEASAEAPLFAAKRLISLRDGEGTWIAEYSEDEARLVLVGPGQTAETTRFLHDSFSGAGGYFGLEAEEARLEFSYQPSQYQIKVENWDKSESYLLYSSQLEDDILPLAPYSAHYTITGDFDTVRDTHYMMEFYFDIGQPADQELWRTY